MVKEFYGSIYRCFAASNFYCPANLVAKFRNINERNKRTFTLEQTKRTIIFSSKKKHEQRELHVIR